MTFEEQVRNMKVVELRAELQKLNLSTLGKKEELISRLLEAKDEALISNLVSKPSSLNLDSSLNGNSTIAQKPFPSSNDHNLKSSISSQNSLKAKSSNIIASNSSSNTENSTISKPGTENPSDEQKKLMRLERFGTSINTKSSNITESLEKMRAREERFGVRTSETLENIENNEQKLKRLERFG